MTLKQITETLEKEGVPDARFDALTLVCHFMKISAARAMTGGEDYKDTELLEAVEKRRKRVPLQYIIGEWDFMGYTFKVTPDTLVPRADTEVLASYLIENIPKGGRFADLCTGSGCIAISALLSRPDISGTAVELYPDTMKVASENAERHGVKDRLEMILGDVCEDTLTGEFDMIVSNPPYITSDEMKEIPPETAAEPTAALTDGGDGLSIIRKIIEIYPKYLKEGGKLAIEFGWKQGMAVKNIAESFGLSAVILTDSESRDRVAVISR